MAETFSFIFEIEICPTGSPKIRDPIACLHYAFKMFMDARTRGIP
jgi:hypothetical protein